MYIHSDKYECDGCCKTITKKDIFMGLSTNARYQNISSASTAYSPTKKKRTHSESFHYCKKCMTILGYKFENKTLSRITNTDLIGAIKTNQTNLKEKIINALDSIQLQPDEEIGYLIDLIIDQMETYKNWSYHFQDCAVKWNRYYKALRAFLKEIKYDTFLKAFDKRQRCIRDMIRRNK